MDGILIINKPKGFTSHDVVNIVRKYLNEKKVGHTGTLDPNATGVLPVLIGKATKLSKYLIEHNKEYIVTAELGKLTNTGDTEGDIIKEDLEIEEKIHNLNNEKIIEILNSFKGEQSQVPPIYSAIKIKGKKAYEYARSGQDIKIEPRKIKIFDIELLNFKDKEIKFKVVCSKGTYIRTLCEDIAKKIGTIGFMKELERTKVNEFNIENSVTIDEIKKSTNKLDIDNIIKKIIKIEELFKEKEKINLNDRKKDLFLNGAQLTFEKQNDIYRIYYQNKFIGLGIIKDNLLKRDIVL